MDFIVSTLKCSNNLNALIYKAEMYIHHYFVNILTYMALYLEHECRSVTSGPK